MFGKWLTLKLNNLMKFWLYRLKFRRKVEKTEEMQDIKNKSQKIDCFAAKNAPNKKCRGMH